MEELKEKIEELKVDEVAKKKVYNNRPKPTDEDNVIIKKYYDLMFSNNEIISDKSLYIEIKKNGEKINRGGITWYKVRHFIKVNPQNMSFLFK